MKLCILLAAVTVLTMPALGQGSTDQTLVFEPNFFQRFVPQTALDMVERVPGFSLDQGENRRGLAGAAGNILIDGRVPVIKGQGIRGILRRIPASTVERLELIRGSGTSASNSQSVILNIIRRQGGGSGVWRATFDYTDDDRLSPNADVTWAGQSGSVEYRVSGDFRKGHDPRSGTEDTFDALGILDERLIEESVRDDARIGLSGEIKTPIGLGELLLVGAVETREDRTSETSQILNAQNTIDGLERVLSDQDNESGELSANYSRKLGEWSTEFSALLLAERSDTRQENTELDSGNILDERAIESETSEDFEGIVRAVASRRVANGAWSFEGEVAFNKLDKSLRLTEDDGSGPVLIDLPGANTLVEETRGEFGLTRSWDVTSLWSVETGFAFELSRLSNEGDFSDERDLSYWKPSIQISRKFGDDDQIRFRLFRDVDQLDFEDFAAGVELDNENINAGNADLLPETSWRAEIAADWRFGDGALELSVFGWDIEEAQDFDLVIAEGEQFDTRGNIGDGTIYGLSARLETPLSFVPGGTIVIGGLWQDSEVEDPLTGETRAQSETTEATYEFEFRQDIEAMALAWGIEFEREEQAPEFRFDRVTASQDRDQTMIWVETTAFGNFKIRLALDDFTGSLQTRDRQRFEPNRLGSFDQFERREREQGPSLSLRLQGVF
ncbi:MAG: hypothetical protein AAGL90_16475 [Pseudomonadota bacterium]